MPFVRRTLSNREQLTHDAELRWFKQAGLHIEAQANEAAPSQSRLDVCIGYAPDFCNAIFDFRPAWLMVITGVRIVARRPNIRLTDEISIQLPWAEDNPFDLWTKADHMRQYWIAHASYDEDQVLNHQLAADSCLQVGKPLEGLLIAGAFQAKLPKKYELGVRLKIAVTFYDTLDRVHTAGGEVTVKRPVGTPLKVGVSRRSTLFDGEMDTQELRQSPRSHPRDGNPKTWEST